MSVANIRDLRMSYDVTGDGPAVVLLHGYPLNRSMWGEQIAALRDGYRVVAPDLRGHGETEATEEPATMEEMAADVAALMDELGINSAVIGGLSMGGYVALAFARRFPERVRALVLADTRPQADTEDVKGKREEQAQTALREGMNPIADTMLPKLFPPAALRENVGAVERVRRMILTTKPQGAASASRGMASRADQTQFLPKINAPTLVIVGGEDTVTPPADAELMRREIPDARLETIEGAGHLPNIERPIEFSHALRHFLNDLQP